jgi:hypothetical protein
MYLLAKACHNNVYSKNLNPGQLSSDQRLPVTSEVTRRSNKHNVQICIADCHYIYNNVVGNMHDVYRHTHNTE